MTKARDQHVDVLVIGAGPAGLFTARNLAAQGLQTVVLDSGKPTQERECPLTRACNCAPCDVLEGVGGSGGVSDGKMTFDLDRGTQLEPIFTERHVPLLRAVEEVMTGYDIDGVWYKAGERIPDGFTGETPIAFSTYPLWHIGSDGIAKFSHLFGEDVKALGADLRTQHRAQHLLSDGRRVIGAEVLHARGGTRTQYNITADHVVLAVGLYGIGWLEPELHMLNLGYGTGPAGIGLRIEAPEEVLAPLFDAFYDWKAIGEYQGITMRSFCCNRYGHIMPEYHRPLGIRNVNGHSYIDPSLRSQSSNFSLQAKITPAVTPDPQAFVRSVARRLNQQSGGWAIRQPLNGWTGLHNGSTPPEDLDACVTYPQARPGDIEAALPMQLRAAFTEYLRDLDAIVPGLIYRGWSYGPEVKYHAGKLPLSRETWQLGDMEGTYAVGDCTGITGSYVSAAITGMIAAQSIATKS